MNKRIWVPVCCLIASVNGVGAQVNDFGVWTSLSVSKEVFKGLTFNLAEDVRFYENASELGTAYTDAGIDYELEKDLQCGLHYRYIRKKQVDDFYEPRQRWYLDLSYRYRFSLFNLSLRERFQSQFRDARSDQKTQSPENHLRSKVTAKADLDRRYTPYMAFEWNYQLNSVEGNVVDNLRYRWGVDYKISKTYEVSLYYMINKEINVEDAVTDYVIGLDVEIDLK